MLTELMELAQNHLEPNFHIVRFNVNKEGKQKMKKQSVAPKSPFTAQYVRYIGQVTSPRRNKYHLSPLNGRIYTFAKDKWIQHEVGETVIIAKMKHSHGDVITWNLHEIKVPIAHYGNDKEVSLERRFPKTWFGMTTRIVY